MKRKTGEVRGDLFVMLEVRFGADDVNDEISGTVFLQLYTATEAWKPDVDDKANRWQKVMNLASQKSGRQ